MTNIARQNLTLEGERTKKKESDERIAEVREMKGKEVGPMSERRERERDEKVEATRNPR